MELAFHGSNDPRVGPIQLGVPALLHAQLRLVGLIAETVPEGLLLRPAVTLPVEIYTPEREREFDQAEADLAAFFGTGYRQVCRGVTIHSPSSLARELMT